MIASGPLPPSLTTGGNCDYAGFTLKLEPEPRKKPSNVEIYTEFVDPPEMPDAVKAAAANGAPCFYGFYFPDAAVHAFNEADHVECPPSSNLKSWIRKRKRQIMHDTSDALGIRCFTRLESYTKGIHDDIVYFAYSNRIKFVKSQCLPVEKIKELMQAMGIEGEPQWILVS